LLVVSVVPLRAEGMMVGCGHTLSRHGIEFDVGLLRADANCTDRRQCSLHARGRSALICFHAELSHPLRPAWAPPRRRRGGSGGERGVMLTRPRPLSRPETNWADAFFYPGAWCPAPPDELRTAPP
jgi:hypothetical protein